MREPVRVPTYLAAQIRAAEAPLVMAGEPLMQRAATALAAIVRDELRDHEAKPRDPKEKPRAHEEKPRDHEEKPRAHEAKPRVLVLAGSGDNGGDVLFAAATLTDAADIDVVLTGSRAHPVALPAAQQAGIRLIGVADVDPGVYALVLDGMIGIGASSDPTLRGTARAAVQKLLPAARSGELTVVAADLPSGIDPDTGTTGDDVVLPASVTVTFGAAKAGFPAAEHLTGRVVLVHLGLPLPDGVGVVDIDRYVHVTGV